MSSGYISVLLNVLFPSGSALFCVHLFPPPSCICGWKLLSVHNFHQSILPLILCNIVSYIGYQSVTEVTQVLYLRHQVQLNQFCCFAPMWHTSDMCCKYLNSRTAHGIWYVQIHFGTHLYVEINLICMCQCDCHQKTTTEFSMPLQRTHHKMQQLIYLMSYDHS